MYEILLVVYLVVALLLIGLVLIQQGKGADMGASFGAGASNTVFGSGGSGNFLTRATAIMAVLFFGISLTLGVLSSNQEKEVGEFDNLEAVEVQSEDVIPADDDVPADGDQSDNDIPD